MSELIMQVESISTSRMRPSKTMMVSNSILSTTLRAYLYPTMTGGGRVAAGNAVDGDKAIRRLIQDHLDGPSLGVGKNVCGCFSTSFSA